jgi:hypothetical protein
VSPSQPRLIANRQRSFSEFVNLSFLTKKRPRTLHSSHPESLSSTKQLKGFASRQPPRQKHLLVTPLQIYHP